MRELHRWFALPARDRREVTEAWLILLLVVVGLRCLALKRLQGLLAGLARLARRPTALAPAEEQRLRHWVAVAAANQLGTPRCLHRSLALQTMLQRRHLRTELRIGVRRRDSLLEAHAWLEREGEPLSSETSAARGYRSLQSAGAGR